VTCAPGTWGATSEGQSPAQPGPTTSQILASFGKDFLALFGATYATAKITVTTFTQTALKSIAAGEAIVKAGEVAAHDVYELMASAYRSAADKYADTAEAAADAAAEAATAATSAALSADAPAGADEAARRAAEYADAAQAHAEEARFWANQAEKATSPKEIGDALQSAKDEAEQAKEDARKAQEEAKKSGASDYQEPSQQPGDEGDTSCEDFRRQIWECEQSGWSTGPCQELLNRLNGCPDMTRIYPNPDTGNVGCQGIEVDPETVEQTYRVVCGALIQPEPDTDPCAPANVTGEVLRHVPSKGCDPTIAQEGCPTQPPMEVTATVFCPPTPPSAPPPPCIPIEGGGLPGAPPPRGFELLLDADELVVSGANGDLDVATVLWDSIDWGLGSSATYMMAPPHGWPPSTTAPE
jgi:hypothetical protein